MKNCETGEWLLPTRISNKSAKMDPSTVSSILPHLLHILVVANGLIFGYLLTVENGDICTFGWCVTTVQRHFGTRDNWSQPDS